MNRVRLLLLAGGGVALGATLAAAATLDLRTGLWEITSTGEASGMPPVPPEVMARMTPEQRAAMMAAIGNSGKPEIVRNCITEKTLQRGLDFAQRERGNCTRTVLNNTSRQIDVRLQCTGAQQASGTFHIESSDPRSMSGTLDLVVSSGANSMTIKRTLQGRWLGSDCGTTKPLEE
ncbi:MAG: DUF3617 domain-containing protein [Acetobacteraceae bacterium]